MTTAMALQSAVPITRLSVKRGSIRLQAAMTVPHRQDQVWSVVTDYDNLGTFMPNFRSRTVGRNGSRVLVEQLAGSSLLPLLRFRLLLEFERQSPERLEFRRRGGSMARFDGFWGVTARPQGSHIHYQLNARHRFPLPSSVLSAAIRSDTNKIMPAIEAELRRRHGGAPQEVPLVQVPPEYRQDRPHRFRLYLAWPARCVICPPTALSSRSPAARSTAGCCCAPPASSTNASSASSPAPPSAMTSASATSSSSPTTAIFCFAPPAPWSSPPS